VSFPSRHVSNRMGKDDNCFERGIHVRSWLVLYVIVASVIQKSESSIFATLSTFVWSIVNIFLCE